MNKGLFLDRDGVINKLINNRPPWKISEIFIYKEIKDIIDYAKSLNFIPIVITNQPDAARGDITYELLNKINGSICKKLNLNNFYICKHPYDGLCECRKPKPGMILKASKEINIDLNKSYMIGDREKDIEAGRRAGCKTISISESKISADYIVKNHNELFELLKKILY